jgi:hypothetical protein
MYKYYLAQTCSTFVDNKYPFIYLFIYLFKLLSDILCRRGIIVYIEYQSACPFIGIGSPHSPASEFVSPLLGATLVRG